MTISRQNRVATSSLRDFDQAAASWDQKPRRVLLARKVVEMIIAEAHPTKTQKALDFGCGTGLVTLGLAPVVGEITAADSSPGMLEQLTAKLSASGIANVRPVLIPHDGVGTLSGRFDLVVSSMTMHHIADVAGIIRQFHDLLAPGGQLAIADLDAEDGSFHDDPTGIQHHGFSVATMENWFITAGLTGVRTLPVMEIQKERASGVASYGVNLTIGRRSD